MECEDITRPVIGAAMKVHRIVGPGALESAYQLCLGYELSKCGLAFEAQVRHALVYDTMIIDAAYRLDFVVEKKVILEIKSVHRLERVHTAQMITYLTMTGCPVGLLINFNVAYLPDGIKRVVR
jgi:GxxExxY protein